MKDDCEKIKTHTSQTKAAQVAAFTSFMRATCKARKVTLFLFSIAVLLGGGVAAAQAQSALDGFDPNANNTVRVIVVQPDGKILIGGDFTALSPNGGAAVTRNRIARLNPDGTLDTAFNPNANGAVFAIAVQADGKILAGGQFSGTNSIGGATRNFIARLDATTGAADVTFDPNASSVVRSIAVQSDTKILVGGDFTTLSPNGGAAVTRNRIARLDATTGAVDSFDPNASLAVDSIVVQPDGKVLVGGDFTTLSPNGGIAVTRNRIARLNTDGTLDAGFNPNANSTVYTIAIQADGKILVGGEFSGANSIGGALRNRIARLDAMTGAADSFDPNANDFVDTIVVQADGKILAGGGFVGANCIGGQTRQRLARLDAVSGSADSFDPNPNSAIRSIAVQADGKILVGGSFSTLSSGFRNDIARLETDGRLDQTLNPGVSGFPNFVYATAVQADGKILIGGGFTTVLGVARTNIARLNTDGTLDTTFSPNADSDVYAIVVQPDGKILVGGFFSTIGGQPRSFIARLNPDGTADSWNPITNGEVNTIAVQADGKVLAGGNFTSIGGQPRNFIARLDATTGLADSWNPNSDGDPNAIAVQSDGKILAVGFFNVIGGQTRHHIARLDATTGLADSWDPNTGSSNFNESVYSIAVQPDGKILTCGAFITIGGQTRNHIARLDPNTGLADSWDPNALASAVVYAIAVQADGKVLAVGSFGTIGGQLRNDIARLDGTTGLADSFDPNADFTVYAIAVQADGKILAGGQFANIGGQPRALFARLSDDTAALQNITATPTTVTWTRGGSSPQFTRVTFESSPDNVNYTSLGNGTATGSNWTLTGLSLPIAQNFYIRARGFYRSGRYADGSTQESVRNAFLPADTDVTLSGGTLTITDANGGNTDDTLTISRNGTNVRINDPNNTLIAGAGVTQIDANTVEVPFANITGNILFDTQGGNDTVTIALAGGNVFPPGGIFYNGGTQTSTPGDKLVITGGNQGLVTYNYTNQHDGNIVIGNFGTVTYTGLEPITNTGTATDITFNLPTGTTNAATLADDGISNTMSRLSGATFETTDFANPTGSVQINRGNAADTLVVNALPDLNSSLFIGAPIAGQEFASVTFNGAITLASSRSLAAYASSTISLPNAASDLATSGNGTILMTTATNLTFASGSSLQTVNGPITLNANQQPVATPGSFVGISLAGATVQATGTGVVTVNGRGATAPGIAMSGNSLISGGTTSATTTTSVTGTGGPGGTNNHGIQVGDTSIIMSAGGDVSVTGNAGPGANTNHGIILFPGSSGGKITSGGSGNVTVNGTGGANGSDNEGILIDGSLARISAAGTGTVNVIGTAGAGTSKGVLLSRAGSIQSSGGAITVTGTHGPTGDFGISITGAEFYGEHNFRQQRHRYTDR